MRQRNFRAFTLVELIVVITIVGILSTVGFVLYSGYLTGARDSNRISQMVKISDSLQVYSATKILPLPDSYVEIHASGSLIAYQGELGVDVLETIDYTNGGTDPKDDSYYTYYLTKDRRSMQIMALMEEQASITQNNIQLLSNTNSIYAADYTDRFPKVYGRKLGVLTEIDTNTPVQQLTAYASTPFDIVSETGEFISHISDDEKLEGTGSTLMASNPKNSCKRIKQTGGASGNGTYTVNTGGIGYIQVYCDMETAGGGWMRSHMLSYDALVGTTAEYSKMFVEDNDFTSSGYTLDISGVGFSEFIYITDDNQDSIEFLHGDKIYLTAGYEDEGFGEWITAYTIGNNGIIEERGVWYYYSNIRKIEKLIIGVTDRGEGYAIGYQNMGGERLLCGDNCWNDTNMPFGKRGLATKSWCPGGGSNCDLFTNGTEGNDWASLWIR